jgi:hypothetical protein
MSLLEMNEALDATGLKCFKRYQRKPITGRDAEVRYQGDVRYLVGLFHGDVMKIDDDRVDRGFNDAVPAVTAAWVELRAQRPPMTAERIAELTSRETP